jgi:hypothetical protein
MAKLFKVTENLYLALDRLGEEKDFALGLEAFGLTLSA